MMYHLRSISYLLVLITIFCSCTSPEEDTSSEIPSGFNTEGYTQEDMGEGLIRLEKRDESGEILETGYLQNGKKVSTWMLFEKGPDYPTKLITYRDDVYEGPYMEIGRSGQLQTVAHYRNNILHGPWRKYKHGRINATAKYDAGELEGEYIEYNVRGRMTKSAHYKNGKLDGKYRNYDDNGQLIVEYSYKDGEKVSGGIQAEN